MIKKMALFWGEDWEGLYIDGKLVYENHHIEAHDVIRILEERGMEAAAIEVDDDWLIDRGTLPADAADVVVHKEEQ